MAYPKECAEYVVSRAEEIDGTWNQKLETIRKEVKERFGITMNVANGDNFRTSVKSMAAKLSKDIAEGKTKAESLSSKLSQLSEEIADEKKKYQVIQGDYHIPTKHGTFVIPCEEADEIFKDYSEHGLNLSQEEIIQKYRLKPEAWTAIKGAFRLYKKSHVISPHTLENAEPKVLDAKIEEAVGLHVDRYKSKFVQTHEKLLKKETDQAIKFLVNEEYRMKMLEKAIEGWKPVPTYVPAIPKNKESKMEDKLFVFMSDMHIGNKGTAQTLAAMAMITQRCISSPEKEIYIVDDGDNGEAFVAMHGGQIEHGTDQSYGYGAELACNIADIMEKMVIEILQAGKQVYFYGMQGNHDRFGKKQEDDPKFSAGTVIYELLKRGLRNTSAKVMYAKERLEAIEYETFVLVLHHGLLSGSPEKFAMPYMHMGKHVFVVSGHVHSPGISTGYNCTHVKLPGLAGPGEYDRDHLMFGQRGAMFAKANDHGSVNFEMEFYETDNTMPVRRWEDNS